MRRQSIFRFRFILASLCWTAATAWAGDTEEVRRTVFAPAIRFNSGSSCTSCTGNSGYCQYVNPKLSVKYGNPCPKLNRGCCGSMFTELFCGLRGRLDGLMTAPIYSQGDCGGCGSCDSCFGEGLGKGRLRDHYPGLGLGCGGPFSRLGGGCGGFVRSLLSPFCGLCPGGISSMGASMWDRPYLIEGYGDACVSGGCGTTGPSVPLSPTPAAPSSNNVEEHLPAPPESPASESSSIDPQARRRPKIIRRTQYTTVETTAVAERESARVTTGLQDAGQDPLIRFKGKSMPQPRPHSHTTAGETTDEQKDDLPQRRIAATRQIRTGRSVQFHHHSGKQTYRSLFR